MTFQTKPRVAESSTTTGTGAFTLSGAYSGSHVRFSSVMSVSDTAVIVIVADDGTWERSLATYSSADTLTRTTVLDSSNAGAAVNFAAGNKAVFLVWPETERIGQAAAAKTTPASADKIMFYDTSANLMKAITRTDFSSSLTESLGLVPIASSVIASSPSTVDFTGLSLFSEYLFIVKNLVFSAGSNILGVRYGTGSGPSWQNTSYDHFGTRTLSSGLTTLTSASTAGAATEIRIPNTDAVDTTAGNGGTSLWLHVFNPIDGEEKRFLYQAWFTSGANYGMAHGGGWRAATGSITGIRFMTTGAATFSSGEIQAYGIRSGQQ